LAKAKRIWHPHSRFGRRWLLLMVILAFALNLGLLVGAGWTSGLAWLPGGSGFDWAVNSGFMGFEREWPIDSPLLFAWVVLAFASFPVWAFLGYALGVILFGRTPKQTGVVGLLR
jgi:hypothetical protein